MGFLISEISDTRKNALGRALAFRMQYEFIDYEDLSFPKMDSAYE